MTGERLAPTEVVTDGDVPVQPFPSVTVTVNVPEVETEIDWVVLPSLQQEA
ncbi:MAG: hypothetical protein IPI23_21235 [Bacteroidetes bacterium]|nr:hypothetical protein [Bacteroidota bacterium]